MFPSMEAKATLRTVRFVAIPSIFTIPSRIIKLWIFIVSVRIEELGPSLRSGRQRFGQDDKNKNLLVDQADQYAESVLNPRFTMISEVYIGKPYFEEGVLKQKYLVEKLSVRQIAEEFSSSKSTILKCLKFYKIKSRKRGSLELAKPNPAYGERRNGNRLVKNQKEVEVIDLILKLHKSGQSYRAVARTLNKMEVPTRSGAGEWHHEVVRSIVKRVEKK